MTLASTSKGAIDKKETAETQSERDQSESSLPSSTEDKEKEVDLPKPIVDDRSSGNQADKMVTDDSGSDGSDVQKGRPMSPGTLALMCDEQDSMFMGAASPNGTIANGNNASHQLPYGQGKADLYAEQERLILTGFRDYLRRLVTYGTIKGKQYSAFGTRAETGTQPVPVDNYNVRPHVPEMAEATQVPSSVTVTCNNNLSPKIGFPAANNFIKPKVENEM